MLTGHPEWTGNGPLVHLSLGQQTVQRISAALPQRHRWPHPPSGRSCLRSLPSLLFHPSKLGPAAKTVLVVNSEICDQNDVFRERLESHLVPIC